ncbi:MAG: hypothetical protein HKP30_15710 [Myxococcales bacterium]|nr:hypothetical protein [Myxococcales bacterium]
MSELRARRWLRRLLAGLGGVLALGLGGFFVVYSAASPLYDDDGAVMRLWKLGAKRALIEGLALGSRYAPGASGLDAPDEGAPFQEMALHPYFGRIRTDPRTRHFYGHGPLDVEDFAAMADFLRGRFPHGFPAPEHQPLNVLELLDAAEQGAVFACGDITKMLIQLAQAGRGHGRPVQLDGHVVAELWSRRYGKWVAVDADYDLHFTDRAGTPLSAYEIHERVRDGRRDALVPQVGASPNALYRSRSESLYGAYEEGLAVFYYAQWISRNLPRWHPDRSPVRTARAYYPEATLEHRVYFARLTEDPASLYAPPAAFRED